MHLSILHPFRRTRSFLDETLVYLLPTQTISEMHTGVIQMTGSLTTISFNLLFLKKEFYLLQWYPLLTVSDVFVRTYYPVMKAILLALIHSSIF